MATTSKTTGTPKKRATRSSVRTKKKTTTKRKPAARKAAPPPEVSEELTVSPPIQPVEHTHVMIDGTPTPIKGIAPDTLENVELTSEDARQSPQIREVLSPITIPRVPPQPRVVEAPTPPPPSAADEREAARAERLRRKQLEREKRQRDRELANRGIDPNTVAEPAPVENLPVQPTEQQFAERAAEVAPPVPPTPQRFAVAPRSEEHADVHIPIPELYQYKVQVLETRMRELATPIRTQLKEAAEAKLRADIVAALAEHKEYQQACRDTEACVNELLKELAPQVPDNYAVVVISAKEGAAVCRFAPDQAGKRFKID